MGKNTGKRRLLFLAKLLWEQTDEEHSLSIGQMRQQLAQVGMEAERKAIYDDLKTLQEYGMDILRTNTGRDCRYFLAGRTFELPELKLLVDAVNASAILTKKQSEQLIQKLSRLTSRPQSVQLRRSLLASSRKTNHTGLYYTIDTIYQALREQTSISFRYYHYGPFRQKVYHQGRRPICCSPYGLVYREERYYLLGYASNHPDQPVCHFRVDRMERAKLAPNQPFRPKPAGLDLEQYSAGLFSMYSGQLSRARIRCTETGLKILYDRFGLDIPVEFLEDGSYLALVEVVPGPVFFGWVIGLSQEMRLTGPEELVEQCRAVAQRSLCPWDLETGGRKSSPEPEQSRQEGVPEDLAKEDFPAQEPLEKEPSPEPEQSEKDSSPEQPDLSKDLPSEPEHSPVSGSLPEPECTEKEPAPEQSGPPKEIPTQ
ncbi:MAG TPA: WYL domain-containing protein [Candidatus Egerieicola faecale]|uniref:WYL domain-containing protein n=1 Tax=Candidatus Egerieicola faecale TaxID=2840774 RepID=A0A9D1ISM4_9FIRM|nr:WYL domain-containing protein [Candidatus Egerieicola faecale]